MPKYEQFESSDDDNDDEAQIPSMSNSWSDQNVYAIHPIEIQPEVAPAEEAAERAPEEAENTAAPKVCVVRARRVSFRKGQDGIEIALNNQEEATKRKADSHINEFDLQLASTLVQDVRYSRSIDFEPTEKSLNSYKLYNSRVLRWTQILVLVTNMGMALFERPALTGKSMPYFVSIILELVCLGFFIFRFAHLWHFSDKNRFWKDKKNQVLVACIALTIIDVFIFIIIQEAAPSLIDVWPRWSRPLRPLFLCNLTDSNQIRRAFRNIRRTIPDIFNVLILFFMTVALFALLGVKLFGSKNLLDAGGKQYFVNYFDSVWDLYVLVTTANNPDVMMPAYDLSVLYSLFFISYLTICLYLFMSIILAVIYNNYKKHLKNEVQKYVYRKRRKLGKAFEILKIWIGGRFVLPKARWDILINEVVPTRGKNYADLLWKVLDEENDNVIEKKSFLNVVDLLNVGLSEVKDRKIWMDTYFPSVWNHVVYKTLRSVITHRAFRIFFDVLIVTNAFVIGLVTDDDAQLNAEYVFLFLFTLEILLKLITFGSKHFFTRLWNVFDTVIIGAALVGTLIEAFADELSYSRETLDILMVLRVLRLVKIMGSIERFKIVIKTVLNIGPSIFTYAIVCYVFFYIYAIVGMEFFSGLIKDGNQTAIKEAQYCYNKNLSGSAFAMDNYCKINFNDLTKAFVTLFTLMVVNQWHVIAEGFVLVTSKWARLYFFSFHMVVVILVLNIFTAFVLEVFILEYSLGKGRMEFAIEKTIHELGLGLDQEKTRDKMGGKEKEKTDTKSEGKAEEEPDISDNLEDKVKYESFTEVAVGANNNNIVVANRTSMDSPVPQLESPREDHDDDDLQDLSQLAGIRFKLTKKKSRKTVEVMLQRLFEDELEDGDEGPDEEAQLEISDDHQPPSPLILRNVMS